MSQFISFIEFIKKQFGKVNLVKMNTQNPYMNIYLNTLSKTKQTPSKDYLFTLAVNLGHAHNLLGVMIADVVNLMGNLSFNHQQKIHQEKTQIQKNYPNNKNNKNPSKNDSKNSFKNRTNIDHFAPQKMEIQNLSIDHFNDKMKTDSILKKQFLFNEYQFRQNQQPKTNQENKIKKEKHNILEQIIENYGQTKNEQHQEDLNTSRTLSAQKVRYNQKYENQFQISQLQSYPLNYKDETIKYEVNVKEVRQKKEPKKKQKSVFFDLFDSSQTSSYPQQEDFIQKMSPISQQIPYNNKTFYQKIPNDEPCSKSNSLKFSKPKTLSYSTQIKDDKSKSIPKNIGKSYDLLQNPFSVNSSKSNLIDIDEIDEIQMSQKKMPKKIAINKKQGSKKQPEKRNQNYDDYIPRRQQIGRKKNTREVAKGSECPDCKAFYGAINNDSNSFKTICECTSRHKSSTVFMKKHHVQNYSQAFSLD